MGSLRLLFHVNYSKLNKELPSKNVQVGHADEVGHLQNGEVYDRS